MRKPTEAHSVPGPSLADAHALVCGTGNHIAGSGLPPIPAVRASVQGIQVALADCGAVNADHVRCVVDPDDAATLADALAETATKAETVLLFHYVGHGLIAPDGELHLATRSSGDLAPGLATYQALPFSVVRKILTGCRAHTVVTILDCCFSGRAAGWTGDDSRAFELPAAHGSYLLASAARNELALAPEDAPHTVFTGAVIRFLRDGDPTGPSELTLEQLYRFLMRYLPDLGASRPHRQSTGGAGDLVLGPNPAYRPPEQRWAPPSEAAATLDASGSGGEQLADETSPYRGLATFGPEDRRWFHGREALIARLVARLGCRLGRPGPLVVVGPSGAGKSSLIRAGLLPALSRGELPGSQRWPVLLLTPGSRPLRSLAGKLAAALDASSADLHAELTADPSACAGLVLRALRRRLAARSSRVRDREEADESVAGPPVGGRLVLVVDQLEEVFALCDDPGERVGFLAALGEAAADPAGPLVILGLRADFYGHCATHPHLVAALDHPCGQLVVGPMTEDEMRDAIVKPAHAAGLELEEGLVDLLQRDVRTGTAPYRRSVTGLASGTGPAAGGELPLLSHALLSTWQLREGRRLTLAGYQAGGGIHHAIARTAEELFLSFDEVRQEACRRLMLRLVAVGADTPDTRRPIPLAELPELDGYGNKHTVGEVVESFVRTRLLTADDQTVQIAHDAMLAHWPRLRQWIEEDRTGHVVRQQISDAARAWDGHGRDRSYLYSGARLASARAWALGSHNADQLVGLEREFLAASTAREGRQVRRLQQVVAILGALVLAATAATGFALRQNSRAEREADRVVVQSLINSVRSGIEQDPDQAMLLAAELVRRSADDEVRRTVLEILDSTAGMQSVFHVDADPLTDLRPLPDGRSVLVAAPEGAWLLDLTTREMQQLPIDVRGGPATQNATVFAEGTMVAAASAQAVEIHDLESGDTWSRTVSRGGRVFAVDGQPSGELVAWGTYDGAVGVFEAGQADDPVGLLRSGPTVLDVKFSPDGQTLAVSGLEDDRGSTVTVWDVDSKTVMTALRFPDSTEVHLAFEPRQGQTLATMSRGRVQLWDARTGDLVSDPTGRSRGSDRYAAFAFHPAGGIVAMADDDGVVSFWSAEAEDWVEGPPTGDVVRSIRALSYTADGNSLVTVHPEGLVLTWDQRHLAPSQPRLGDQVQWTDDDQDMIVDWLCEVAGRDLTRSEWEVFLPTEEYRSTCSDPPSR